MQNVAPPKVLVPIADGTEEIEAVCIIDVLRRAGAEVTVASVDNLEITASRGVQIVADCLIEDCQDIDYTLIVLPGGIPGAERLRDSPLLIQLLHRHKAAGGLYGAICAAPALVLSHHGLLEGCPVTGHPAFADQLNDGQPVAERVVTGDRCITSQGPGTALEFALALVARLFGPDRATEVAAPMLVG